MKSTPKHDPVRSSGSCLTADVKPVADAPARTVIAGGWFVAEDLNGDLFVVRLPPRAEHGS